MKTSLSEEEAFQLGVEAYIYGYPLILMNVTKDVATAVPAPGGMKAPINQFVHETCTSITGRYQDTLTSVAWLDLSWGPMILSLPDTQGRYYLMSLLDAWTHVFASIGSRTTGTGEQDFVIVGPDWIGTLPEQVQKIQAPTHIVWMIGQTQLKSPADYPVVQAIQAQYRLTPLRQWGRPYTPPTDVPVNPMIDLQTPPNEQVKQMDVANFFGWLCYLLKSNPPGPADAEFVSQLVAIGIVIGEDFNVRCLNPSVISGLTRSMAVGHQQITETMNSQAQVANHWSIAPELGNHGTDYLHRARLAWESLGAPLAADMVHLKTEVDCAGERLSGKHRYTMHFPADQLPPVQAFWSLLACSSRENRVRSSLDRHTLSQSDALMFNPDGSLDLYIQTQPPGPKQRLNWLHCPSQAFDLSMRLYWPKLEILNRTWLPPPVLRIT